jgi:hypothetical protein
MDIETRTLEEEEKLGAGRSGQVFLVEEEQEEIARKVFTGDRLTNLIHYVLSGAPNAYIWNEDAIWCGYYRRKILKTLVPYWFGNRLLVSDALDVKWNEEMQGYQLDTEFVAGRPVALRQPFRRPAGEPEVLVEEIMEPLQQRFREAGFDGLVWQAGQGNPVALNNFLLVENDAEARQFASIDLESGVPAIIAFNPVDLFAFYIPKGFKHGRPMFDDVDTKRVRQYLAEEQEGLLGLLGQRAYAGLCENVERLHYHQERWRGQSRLERSLEAQQKMGRISADEAAWYGQHPFRWYWRELDRGVRKMAYFLFVRLGRKVISRLRAIDYGQAWQDTREFVTSQEYRTEIGRNYVRRCAQHWQERGQLRDDEARQLLDEIDEDESSAYLSDFGAHIGLKLSLQLLEYTLFAVLYTLGIINAAILAAIVLADGMLYRSAYTLYRIAHATRHGEERPWIALGVGIFPLIGSLAFPVQMLYSGAAREDQKVASFIIYDTFSRIGARIPIAGGEDTRTEHFFNRLADRIVRRSTRWRGARAG